LKVVKEGSDYFFPYVGRGSGGVGKVTVPSPVKTGTLVVTNAVNGCALQVNKRKSGYEFYHDADGACMSPESGRTPDEMKEYREGVLYRVTSSEYWTPRDKADVNENGKMPKYYIFFVKTEAAGMSYVLIRPKNPRSRRSLGMIVKSWDP
jgi:hypothetical protein